MWMGVLLILLVVGGLCAVGFWQTYDSTCGAAVKTWSWTQLPPKYVCRTTY
jgi:hypothetical protein